MCGLESSWRSRRSSRFSSKDGCRLRSSLPLAPRRRLSPSLRIPRIVPSRCSRSCSARAASSISCWKTSPPTPTRRSAPAVRDVHAGCRRVLERYVTLEPILAGREGEADDGRTGRTIDPAAVPPGRQRDRATAVPRHAAPPWLARRPASSCRRSARTPDAPSSRQPKSRSRNGQGTYGRVKPHATASGSISARPTARWRAPI